MCGIWRRESDLRHCESGNQMNFSGVFIPGCWSGFWTSKLHLAQWTQAHTCSWCLAWFLCKFRRPQLRTAFFPTPSLWTFLVLLYVYLSVLKPHSFQSCLLENWLSALGLGGGCIPCWMFRHRRWELSQRDHCLRCASEINTTQDFVCFSRTKWLILQLKSTLKEALRGIGGTYALRHYHLGSFGLVGSACF